MAFANPKTLIFQAAFLPQFLTTGEGRQAQLWLLAGTFWVITVVGEAIWVLCASRARAALSGKVQLWADRVSGGCEALGERAGAWLSVGRARLHPFQSTALANRAAGHFQTDRSAFGCVLRQPVDQRFLAIGETRRSAAAAARP